MLSGILAGGIVLIFIFLMDLIIKKLREGGMSKGVGAIIIFILFVVLVIMLKMS